MPRWFLLPGQNYTGPFNSIDLGYRRRYLPVDALDRASLRHDLSYRKLRRGGTNPYLRFNRADEVYLRRIRRVPGWRAVLARTAFRFKRVVG